MIRLSIESRPCVYVDALNEGEEQRLADWLESHAQYAALVSEAFELASEEKAA